MTKVTDLLKIMFGLIRCFPHLVVLLTHRNRSVILKDTAFWMEIRHHSFKPVIGCIFLLETYPEFRSVFYYRIGGLKYFLKWFCPPRKNLLIAAESIGEKLYIHHGYSSIIGAKSIGKNCMIYQGVTVGSINGAPRIGDHVTVFSGAIVIGNITIGNHVNIGANATVHKDVPDHTTVYPPVCRYMRWPQSGSGDESACRTGA